MAKVEGMRGKDNSKSVFVKKGAPNIAPTFHNNNVNNNNKRPNAGRDVAGDKRVKVEGTSFKTCWGRVEECWAAGELWIDHKKDIFFPCSSATTCANHLLGVEQRNVSSPEDAFQASSIATLMGDAIL
ncbi:hypothetical protein Taro_006321 [Colocasia esculenta]|uniref:Uncharacterized protein n=1 Tax=Colocasia esculenta TaxID=4460 RepID=A0A843TX18_COLES|nr:hypothetical protein [Colocasia esculenta]